MSPGDPPTFPTARRGALFDQLLALFLDQGFVHLTLDDIAARLHCSKSTLYTLARSKDDLVRAVTVHFFRAATEDVERAVIPGAPARERIASYLAAVGRALGAASPQFMADLNGFAPAREVYETNTRIASRRVQQLIADGVAAGEFRDVHAAFAAELAATMMVSIQQGRVHEHTGLDDAAAYRELAAILTAGINA